MNRTQPYHNRSPAGLTLAVVTTPSRPRRLIRMLQELNLAHANEMDMATAMLVRAITDHVPPIFGKTTFADVPAQHSAGSNDGRSFKSAMSHLTGSMKHVADGILHVHIRPTETLPNSLK